MRKEINKMGDSVKRIWYVHPSLVEGGGDYCVSLTKEQAIEFQKKAAASKGYTYSSNEDALDDFMVIHWAWEE